ncbi:MAG: hypothetical protein EZS28_007316 [Streblomastix strix]|uniref:S1 motif domain-containing protein n=1 Tax=Streblomastix strix TaxID=222440 RepID=A0A5J4WQI2_9EUKA|nr:MAG: hypothetical protein EZS28_007316 [Streblomastix strix]
MKTYINDSHTLTESQLLLGCVKEVQDLQAVLSVLGNQRVYLPITQISSEIKKMVEKAIAFNDQELKSIPALSSILKCGMKLQVRITQIERETKEQEFESKNSNFSRNDNQMNQINWNKRKSIKKIEVTCDPKEINKSLTLQFLRTPAALNMLIQGSVQSEEDNGYVIDLGSANFSGFLPFNELRNNMNQKSTNQPDQLNQNSVQNQNKLIVGAIIHCRVKNVKSNIVQLSLDFDQQYHQVNEIQCQLLDVERCDDRKGILVLINSPQNQIFTHCFIPRNKIPFNAKGKLIREYIEKENDDNKEEDEDKDKVNKSKKNNNKKKINKKLKMEKDNDDDGDEKDSQISDSDNEEFDLDDIEDEDEEDDDDSITKLSTRFPPGICTVKLLRIIDYNLIDSVFIGSLQQQHINSESILNHNEINYGQVMYGQVIRVLEGQKAIRIDSSQKRK